MTPRLRFPDPVHGTIELPDWYSEVSNQESIRRMMLIRQLGLKAYVDFPGAIHTRFSHALGTMQLARKLVTLLADVLSKAGQPNKAANLEANLNNLMAAGLLHDIGHGPFSHVVDYPASKLLGKTHVEVGAEIIATEFGRLEHHGVTISSVINIIKGQHAHPFLHEIIDGLIDVDKLDYLLRDSHHVGLRYHFDLDQFLYDYLVLGNDDALQSCALGLTDTLHARTTAEIFVLIWKGMYDLVYHIEDSRIAEKMLEHAILAGCKKDTKLKAMFSEETRYRKLYDDMVLDAVGKVNGFPEDAVERIRTDNLYRPAFSIDLSQRRYAYGRRVIESLLKFDENEVADTSIELSKAMCKELDLKADQLIVDLVKSRKPKSIHIKGDRLQDQPKYLEDESDVIGAIESKIYLKAYIHPALPHKISENDIEKHLKKELETWS